jgi:hypothetical protein
VAGLALVAAGAVGCSSSGSGGDAKPGGAAVPAGIQVPAKIGTLQKGPDDGAKAFKGDGIPDSVTRNLHAVSYMENGDIAHTVVVTGGVGLPVPSDGPADKIKRLFSEWAVGSFGDRATKVTAGSAGGSAECAFDAAYPKDLTCGWINGKIALVLSFSGFEQGHARSLVPQILAAMVR